VSYVKPCNDEISIACCIVSGDTGYYQVPDGGSITAPGHGFIAVLACHSNNSINSLYQFYKEEIYGVDRSRNTQVSGMIVLNRTEIYLTLSLDGPLTHTPDGQRQQKAGIYRVVYGKRKETEPVLQWYFWLVISIAAVFIVGLIVAIMLKKRNGYIKIN